MSGNSFVYDSNIAGSEPQSIMNIQAIVEFRPLSSYDGQFGFDWFRVGDSDVKGDFHFKDIIGRYYNVKTKSTYHKNISDNKTETIIFERSSELSQPKVYVNKKNSFYKIGIPWKHKKDGSTLDQCYYTYYTPRLTLMLGNRDILSVITEINPKKNTPQKIELKFENNDAVNFLSLDKSTLQTQSGKSTLTITCTKEFSTTQILNVVADGKLCGKLKITPNTKEFQKDIKVVFVKVKTKINKAQIGVPEPNSKELFIKTLNQALITVSEGIKEITLDCTGWFGESLYFTYNYCKSKDGKYVIDYTQVFFLNESCINSKNAYLNGYAYLDSFFGVYFSGHNAATVGHEMFHALGLQHTFDYTNPNKSDYAYQIAKTDNMLDYSHVDKIDRHSLFYWQWRKLNPQFPNVE